MNGTRRRWGLTGAVLLLALGGSGCRDLTAVPRQSQIERVDLAATVSEDGTVRVEQRVTFVDDTGGLLAVPATSGRAELTDITVDGRPVATASGPTEVRAAARTADVAFTVRRAVETWSDITVLQLAVHADASDASRQDPLVGFHATITLPAAAAAGEVLAHWQSSLDRQVHVDGAVVTLDGQMPAWTGSDVAIGFAPGSVQLPPDDAAVMAHTTPHRADFQALQAQRDAATASLEDTLDDQAALEDLVEPAFLGLAGAVLLVAFVSTRRGQRAERRRRAALDDDVPEELSEPPGPESPAVVSLLAAKGERVGRGAVAGTILALAHRGVVDLYGITSEQFVLRLPQERPAVSDAEAVVLDALADVAGPTRELRGPPLWRTSSRRFRTSYRRAVVAEASEAGLVERTHKTSVFMTYATLFASCTWPLWLDQRYVLLLGALTVAGLIASIPLASSVSITDDGVRRRAGWLAYRRWLRERGQLSEVGAPGVAIWGPQLTYGAALGVARAAVAALSPDDADARVDPASDIHWSDGELSASPGAPAPPDARPGG